MAATAQAENIGVGELSDLPMDLESGDQSSDKWERWRQENPDAPGTRLHQLPKLDLEGLHVNRSVMLPINPSGGASMELHFIGTASCNPGATRGVSCTILRRDGDLMVFDAGEGTQTMIQQAAVTVTKIQRIFVTHVHGDHTFGLMGLLCMMGQEFDRSRPPVDVYGPRGLRGLLRATAQLTASRIVPPYRVHELHDVPWLMPLPGYMAPPAPPPLGLDMDGRYGEVPGGRDIRPDADGFWTLVDESRGVGVVGEDYDAAAQLSGRGAAAAAAAAELSGSRSLDGAGAGGAGAGGAAPRKTKKSRGNRGKAFDRGGGGGELSVRAGPMVHTVPCVGFVVAESPRPGSLNDALVAPMITRNSEAFKAKGLASPRSLKGAFKLMKPTDEFIFPDGTVLKGSDAVSPPRAGRKVPCWCRVGAKGLARAAPPAAPLLTCSLYLTHFHWS